MSACRVAADSRQPARTVHAQFGYHPGACFSIGTIALIGGATEDDDAAHSRRRCRAPRLNERPERRGTTFAFPDQRSLRGEGLGVSLVRQMAGFLEQRRNCRPPTDESYRSQRRGALERELGFECGSERTLAPTNEDPVDSAAPTAFPEAPAIEEERVSPFTTPRGQSDRNTQTRWPQERFPLASSIRPIKAKTVELNSAGASMFDM
jgi:hypothetical protein